LLELRLEERRIEPRDNRSLLHDRVEIGAEPGDVPRHLAADLHRRHRLERAGRADRVDDVAARDRRGHDLDVGAAALHVVRAGTRSDGRDDQETDDCSLHASMSWRAAYWPPAPAAPPAAPVALSTVMLRFCSVVCCRRSTSTSDLR